MIDKSIVEKAIIKYGPVQQSIVCMEECSELIQAISKNLRGKSNNDNLTEEIADVLICIETLKQLWEISDAYVDEYVKKKQERMMQRMDGKNE